MGMRMGMGMGMVAALCLFLILLSTFRSVSTSSLSPKYQFLGIAPEDEQYFKKSSDLIKCKHGSKKFTKAQLNDDFCDCPDGTDEPGTSACPNGRFYCRNAGHSPKLLFSSRVNDGICDCCDGSDEYNDTVKCPNTCWEAGKVARDKLKKKISTYQEGLAIRKHQVQLAKEAMAKDEAELSKLQTEVKTLKGLVQDLQERKDQIEKAEEKERLQKEKEEMERKEADEKNKDEGVDVTHENGDDVKKSYGEDGVTKSTNDDTIPSLENSSSDQDIVEADVGLVAEHEHSDTSKSEESFVQDAQQLPEKEKEESAPISETVVDAGTMESPNDVTNTGNAASENTEELSREELGRLVASRWTGENTGKQTEDANSEKDDNHEDNDEVEEMPKDTHDDEEDSYASETDDDQHRYDDDIIENEAADDDLREENHDDSSSYKYDSDTEYELSDSLSTSNPSFLEKIQQKVRNILQAVNLFQTPVNQSDAARIRKEYDESSAKLSKMQSRISSLTQKLKNDFGVDKEFYSFYGQCFESKQNKYVYKVCPYKEASQEEGHSSTRLGRWDKFEDSYRTIVFSNGDKCWNGPDRSLKVKLRCGLKNEVADVDEPSRCEYVAILSTPALCLEEKLKELQQKLDGMNKEQPQNHDEL